MALRAQVILIVTATPVETTAVLEAFDAEKSPINRKSRVYYKLPEIRGCGFVLTQCEMGSDGPAGSHQVTLDAIEAWKPIAVIMVGIAFGMKGNSQKLSDILISKYLRNYGIVREGAQLIARGPKPEASSAWLNFLDAAKRSWTDSAVEPGILMSGPTLVDNLDFRKKIQQLEPEAIGGDMEAWGIYGACTAKQLPWVVVKSICDFGDGEKAKDKSARQLAAANMAAAFVRHVFGTIQVTFGNGHGNRRISRGVLAAATVGLLAIAAAISWRIRLASTEHRAATDIQVGTVAAHNGNVAVGNGQAGPRAIKVDKIEASGDSRVDIGNAGRHADAGPTSIQVESIDAVDGGAVRIGDHD